MKEYNLFETPLLIRGLFILILVVSPLIIYILLFHLKFEVDKRVEATVNKNGPVIVMSNSSYPLNKVSNNDIRIAGVDDANIDSLSIRDNKVILYLNESEEKPFLNLKNHYLIVKQHKSVFKILMN